MTVYNHKEIERRWRERWSQSRLYQPSFAKATEGGPGKTASRGKPYYNLMMFPYPSAEGLHVGNMYAFTGADVWGRYMRMRGFDVFQPIGLDGFGIHSENYAIKVGKHPVTQAKKSQENFYRQLAEIGNGFAWENRLETYDPDYYRWTQWIFVKLLKEGLAYRKEAPVNWCPSCKTVLADEQVIDGRCERCNSEVEQKKLRQWFFRITEYADRLLENLAKIDWDEKVKAAQKNWIGKKGGINIRYQIVGTSEGVTCFTTTPVNFAATFLVLAPDHPLIERLTFPKTAIEAVAAYVQQSRAKTTRERLAEGREKTGVDTGLKALNHVTHEEMPIWISDFVLAEVGTGAIQGCPGHDRRDFEFAKKFGLPIKRVVVGPDGDETQITRLEQVIQAGEPGKMINSEFLNGMDYAKAMEETKDYFERKGWGKKIFIYHLRDWLISRQRYWGPPIPMIYCEKCAKEGRSWFTSERRMDNGKWTMDNDQKEILNSKFSTVNSAQEWAAGWYPVPEEELPVLLPYVEDYQPRGQGKSPLEKAGEKWLTVKCPGCGGEARRETDVSDTFLDSAWYFLRYPSTSLRTSGPSIGMENGKLKMSTPRSRSADVSRKLEMENETEKKKFSTVNSQLSIPWDPEVTRQWLPVDMYIGGAEHSVLHLLYSRFLTMVFKDMGLTDFEEPFTAFRAHGLIIKDGAKMSKSKGNVVTPDEYIDKFGADTLRTYLMFLGPLRQGGDFRDSGIVGMYRFLERVWNIFNAGQMANGKWQMDFIGDETTPELKKKLNWAIKRATDGMERLKYNTAIAALMELTGAWRRTGNNEQETMSNGGGTLSYEDAGTVLKLMAPFAPHMTEELWHQLHIANSKWQIGEESRKKIGSRDHELYAIGHTQFSKENSIHLQAWPTFDENSLKTELVTVVVQVNGKVRSTIELANSTLHMVNGKEEVAELAAQDEKVKPWLEGKKIKKTVWVPGKLVNFVVG